MYHAALVRSAQRRPEITPGYDRPRPRNDPGRTRPPLNEGRRLPPATTGRPAVGVPVRFGAQRRPEITPGYDHPGAARPLAHLLALNEGRRLPPATTGLPVLPARPPRARSTKAGDYPRLRPSALAVAPERLPRSTKAGDYPRLRPVIEAHGLCTDILDAQRRPEITPGYDAARRGESLPDSADAQRRPEITPGYDRLSAVRQPRQRPALNEGRRLPPATTRNAPSRRRCARWLAQRRPEITPGYDAAV